MGSPVRFRRGAPPQTSSSGRVSRPASCVLGALPTAICQRFARKHTVRSYQNTLGGTMVAWPPSPERADDNRQLSLIRRDHLDGHGRSGATAVQGLGRGAFGVCYFAQQAPQPLPRPPGDAAHQARLRGFGPTLVPTPATRVPLAPLVIRSSLLMPLGGRERALGKVRFARLIHSGARVLGGPLVRAACCGHLSLTY